MQFSYYIFPLSYINATAKSIEDNFKELNSLVMTKSDSYDDFFYDASLLCLKVTPDVVFAQIIYEHLPDRQFRTMALPALMRKIPMREMSFNDKASMDIVLSESTNALWGISFRPAKVYCLTSINDYITFRFNSVKSAINSTNFQTLKKQLFKKLIFSEDVAGMVRSIATKEFNQIIDRLIDLDEYNQQWTTGGFSVTDITQETALTISDESDTVKQNYNLKAKRHFVLPEIGRQYCYYHIKTGNYRFHFYVDEQNHQIYVAYIGPHLPLR